MTDTLKTSPSTVSAPLDIHQEIQINASADKAFRSLLHRLGPAHESPAGPMPMKLECHPGGRWYRDLGDGNGGQDGHLWGTVQVIKQDALLEITGPLFMSYAALNHLSFRLTPDSPQSTRLSFRHQAIGLIQDDHRQGVTTGWTDIFKGIKHHAEHH